MTLIQTIIYPFIFTIVSASDCTGQINNSRIYLNQKPPGLLPEIFAPDIISLSNESEFGSVFSKDGKEFFYGVDIEGRTEIRYTELQNSRWTEPKAIISHEVFGYNDPFLSPDESELYYISDQPADGMEEKKDHDIWYSKRTPEGWSDPINAGPNINSDRNEYYISFTNTGDLYFASNKNAAANRQTNFDIYVSKKFDGKFQSAVKLSNAVNTTSYEADVFIAPDESYIIFAASRTEGLGHGDLYISFKLEDGSWSKSKNMGETINSTNHELCPFVTADRKYFFYTSNKDIYWVDAAVIQKMR
ncbi:MAG: hypothetical protein ACR2MX_18750 [Cyclobacteriaceae bacterium]